MREETLEDYTVRCAEALGWSCLKLAKVGGRGWPDRTIIGPDSLFATVELKKDHEADDQPLQRRFVQRLTEWGHYARFCCDKKEVYDFYLYLIRYEFNVAFYERMKGQVPLP